ncbi:glycosyltransferase family 2 protein [Winogradskyella sediminis]|uniref:Glycosyltransferase, GT2 family n=1 Tax=Winogradskyella sediminis TaxID=1382466 RepID=A0A1H1VKX5_9FLAO|nr:glycosyltransferase family A protein [Winogradskyella sediminis]SDS84689.1 Glycosyltransferase, GT2 family [Winogradskyella sediminis]
MLFTFLKYLQPTHYFRLPKYNGHSIFPKVGLLPDAICAQLTEDLSFSSATARSYDLSWQAVQKGYIGSADTYTQFENIPVVDNYRFARKYFSSFWVFYVLVIRLLSFYNPITEVLGWWKTRKVSRSTYLKIPLVNEMYATFESELIQQKPLVSVIIPTLNRYPYLEDVLHDLEQQAYTHFEVIIIDQSLPFQPEFYTDYQLELQVVHQEEKALWLARNRAVKMAKGEYILLFDDDSRVDKNWISEHLKGLDFFKADLSSGVSISEVGAPTPAHYAYFKISDQLDTGNVLLKKDIFKAIGLFDRQFEKQRMGDGEFGLRSYLAGYLNISHPYAKRLHLKVGSGGLRDMGSWDAFRTNSLFEPRPIPSVLYYFRRYWGNSAARWSMLRTVPLSIMPYRFKGSKPMMLLGGMVSIFILPMVVFQVLKSWRLANKKLRKGALIAKLEE